ncbi:MAG: hypothetical protein OEU46_07950 [Alphaproteobacteria bacterium]|nr:hypothetical protein [Alphaproteobacteria bacterium]
MYGFHQAFRTLAAIAVTAFFVVAGIAAPAVAMPVTIDFETDGNGAALAPGATIAGNEWANLGITLSSTNGALRLFDSNCGPGFGTTCTGGDGDLGTGFDFAGHGDLNNAPPQGNVLIRQNLPHNGEPDDSGAAGTIRFDFDHHVRLISIALLDNDNGPGITLNIFKNNEALPSTTILRPSVDFNNFFETFLFAGDATWVTRLDVVFPSSGAIAALTVSPVPLPAALPLLLSALAWLGWAARRRRRITV